MMRTMVLAIATVSAWALAQTAQGVVLYETSGTEDPVSNGWPLNNTGAAPTVFGDTDEEAHWRLQKSDGGRAQYLLEPDLAAVTDPTGWTLTTRMKVNSAGPLHSARHRVMDNLDYWGMFMQDGTGELAAGVYTLLGEWESSQLSEMDPTGAYHTYQIVFDPDEEKATYYIDGGPVGEFGRDEVPDVAGNLYIIFGSQRGPSDWQVSLVRFETGQHPMTPGVIPGDANKDGKVTDADAAILATNWQKQEEATWEEGDFNKDGKVTDADAAILATHWQEGVEGGAAPVPEPTGVVLLASAFIWLLLWLRGRGLITRR